MLDDVLHQAPDTRPKLSEPGKARTLAHFAVNLEDSAKHPIESGVFRAEDRLIPELREIERQDGAMRNVTLWCLDMLEIGFAHGSFKLREKTGKRLLIIPDMSAIKWTGATEGTPKIGREAEREFKANQCGIFGSETGGTADQ